MTDGVMEMKRGRTVNTQRHNSMPQGRTFCAGLSPWLGGCDLSLTQSRASESLHAGRVFSAGVGDRYQRLLPAGSPGGRPSRQAGSMPGVRERVVEALASNGRKLRKGLVGHGERNMPAGHGVAGYPTDCFAARVDRIAA